MMKLTLYIGDRNYSSWSLRPWLVLKWSGLEFSERFISLDQPGYGQGKIKAVLEVSPTGRVPALAMDETMIWDSLAISETIAELAPDANLWPTDTHLRAAARAVTCEMHSGFSAVRQNLPMNIRRRCDPPEWSDEVKTELDRLTNLFTQYRSLHHESGPHLFGQRCIADAFFTPIAARMRTYSVSLGELADQYCETLLSDSSLHQWEKQAEADWKSPFSMANLDELYA